MSNSTEVKKYIHILIVVFLFFGFRFIPPIEPITEVGMGVIGVLLGVIYGWTFIEIGWVSILAISALVLTGVTTIGQVYAISIGSDSIMLTVTILIFAGILEMSGTSNYMLNWILTRKVIEGKPWVFSFVMFIACLAMSTTSGFPILIIFVNMMIVLAKQVGLKPYSKYITCMFVGLTLACLFGSILFPFKPTPIILMGVYTNLTGATINAGSYLLYVVVLSILTLVIYTLLCRFVFRVDVSLIADIDMKKLGIEEVKATTQQKIIMIATVAMIVLLLLPSFISAENPVAQILLTIGNSGTVFCIMVLLNIIRIDGKPVAEISKAASKGVAWDTLFLCIIIMGLSSFVGSPATGVNIAIEQIFAPLLASMGPIVFIAGLLVISVVLTNFLNNILVATVFIPVVVAVAPMLGLAVEPLVVLLILTVHLAVALPAASPFAAVMFSFSDWVRIKEATPIAVVAIIVLTVMFCTVGYFLALMIL